MLTKLLLGTPLPILAIVATQGQVGTEGVDPTSQPLPAWAAVLIAGIWAAASVLQMYGKLPGSGGGSDRRKSGFNERDRDDLREVREALTDKDADGVGRFIGHAKVTRELAEAMSALSTAIAEDRDARAEYMRLVNMNIETLQSMKKSLSQAHGKLDDIKDAGAA